MAANSNPILSLQEPQGGNMQYNMMCALAKAFQQGQKQQDAQPDPMIAYVEKAYAAATQNMSFEARQAYWKMLSTHMDGMPNSLQAFVNGQNDLFNNNSALENLFKELENWQSKLGSDKSEMAKDKKLMEGLAIAAAASLAVPIVGPILAGALALAAAGAYGAFAAKAGDVKFDAEKVQDLQTSVNGVEGAIEGQSQALGSQLGSNAQRTIGDSQMASNSLTGLLKSNMNAAEQICKSESN
jgi:hypothetical protein